MEAINKEGEGKQKAVWGKKETGRPPARKLRKIFVERGVRLKRKEKPQ